MMTRVRVENYDNDDTLTRSFEDSDFDFLLDSADFKFSWMDAIVIMNGICIQISMKP